MQIIGKVAPLPRGAYSSSATYNHLDIVTYSNASWICKQDNVTDVTPAEGNTWMMIVSNGDISQLTLGDLADVDVTSVTDGQTIIYDSTNQEWITGDSAGNLSELKDVDTTGVTDGQTIIYDDANDKWIAGDSAGKLSELKDVDPTTTTSPTNGQILKYDSTASKWKANTDTEEITLSKAEYDALTTEQKNDIHKVYYVYDDESDVGYYELEVTLSSAVASGGTIRIPASGTDSHITTNCTIIPTSELKSDGTPYGYSSIVGSTGYVTITAGEAIPASTKIGVVVYN